MPNEDALTESQWIWVQCQVFLDEGMLACAACDTLGLGPYCTGCGVRLTREARLCAVCHTPGWDAYCAACGNALGNAVAEAIAEDRFDWDAWARSLQPFLGGLTPLEQALLARR